MQDLPLSVLNARRVMPGVRFLRVVEVTTFIGTMTWNARAYIIIRASAFCAALSISAMAQSRQPSELVIRDDNNCESNKALWDYTAVESKGDLIILMARLGDGEHSPRLNRRRLHNIYTYLNYIRELPAGRIVKAEGERARGRGRVEVYLRGNLFAVFTVGRNEDLQGGSCEERLSPLYYPKARKKSRSSGGGI